MYRCPRCNKKLDIYEGHFLIRGTCSCGYSKEVVSPETLPSRTREQMLEKAINADS